MIRWILSLLVLASCSIGDTSAQNALLFPHLDEVQQVLQRNPAKPFDAKVSVALGSAFAGYRNGIFKRGDYDPDFPLLPQVEAVVREHTEVEKINFAGRADLFGLSILTEVGRFSVGVSQRADAKFSVPPEFTNYIFLGNEFVEGQNLVVRDLNGEASAFVEVALRYQTPVQDNGWSFGGSLKFLGGQGNGVLTDAVGSTLNETIADTFLVEASGRLQSSGVAAFGTDTTLSITTLIRNPNNFGLGLDMGVYYQVDDTWSFGLSLLDVGFIRWKRRVYDAEFGARFRSEGFSAIVSPTGNLEELADNIGDLVVDDPFPETMSPTDYGEPYTRAIKPSLLGTVSAQVSDMFEVGMSYAYDADVLRGQHSVGVNAKLNAGKYVQALAGYSYTGSQQTGLGLGLALAFGPLQIYATADNVLDLTNEDKFDEIAANAGVNLIFPIVWFDGSGGYGSSKGLKSRSKKVKCYKF